MAALLRHLADSLRKSGPAPDSAEFLRQTLRPGLLTTFLLRYARLRVSPDALTRVRALPLALEERAALFRQAVSLLNVNETYKTTGLDRTKLADSAIERLTIGLKQVRLLDIGASDGSASAALLARLPNLGEAILTDLHARIYARGPQALRLFLDGQRRLLGVKILGLYINISSRTPRDAAGFSVIDTLNPLLAKRFNVRAILPFDAHKDVLDKPAHVIKCANLLNRTYFPDEVIRATVDNLRQSLVEGGLLFISQNNTRYAEGEAYFILRKQAGRMILVEERNRHEAVDLFEGESRCASS